MMDFIRTSIQELQEKSQKITDLEERQNIEGILAGCHDKLTTRGFTEVDDTLHQLAQRINLLLNQ